MKRFAFLLAFIPIQAGAVPYTVLEGPEVPVVENPGEGFPHYDLAALCKRAWPEEKPTTQAARTACETRQSRLAGIASRNWSKVPAQARGKCVQRADAAGSLPYYVLYTCVNAALFSVNTRETAKDVANVIRKQNGASPLDTMPVGSIR